MATIHKALALDTKERIELIDITREIESFIGKQKLKNGICLVYAPHATAAIVANENEPGVIHDTIKKIREEFPKEAEWEHNRIDNNASAHLASSFIGASKVFPVIDGKLVRGTWQNIFFVELDGPRKSRNVVIQVVGD